MHHHLLVHLRPKTKVSTIDKILKTTRLDHPNPKVVRQTEGVGVLSVVETTPVNVVISSQVASSVFKRDTLWDNSLRIRMVVEIPTIELNLHHCHHKAGFHLEEPLLVLAKGKTIFMQ